MFRPRPRTLGRAQLSAPFAMVMLAGCFSQPEAILHGCWTETAWSYERVDDAERLGPDGVWTDGVRLRDYPDRKVVRHEAELWHFAARGGLRIHYVDGSVTDARWRLKGRGHVLTIRHGDEGFEVYDIKDLTDEHLTLHYDMGVEVRGIARLQFGRTSCLGETPTDRHS